MTPGSLQLSMNPLMRDPYALQSRLVWHNRWRSWAQHPGEIAFHATGWLALAALLGGIVLARGPALLDLLRSALAWPEHVLGLNLLATALDQQQFRRRQRREWQQDWLAAAPLRRSQRRWRRGKTAATRWLIGSGLLILPLLAAGADIPFMLLLLASGALAALLGQRLGDVDRAPRTGAAARQRIDAIDGPGRLWRWQAIEALATFTPRQFAWLLLGILLVPRGGPVMALVALAVLAVIATLRAWQRMLAVIPLAQAWLQAQPLRGSAWLRRATPLPLALLAAASALASAAAAAVGSPALLLVTALGLPALALLQLLLHLALRGQPRQLPVQSALQFVLLLACLQAFAPLALGLWLLLIALWTRRVLRS